jgi:hypothetical protein
VCPQPDSNSPALQRLRELRLGGDRGGALQEVTLALSAQPGDLAVMAEAVRTLVVAEQSETAARLFRHFSGNPLAADFLEPEVIVRLALLQGRPELTEDLPPPDGPAWLAHFLKTGQDPISPLRLKEMQVRVASGPSVYFFTGDCPHCGHPSTVRVAINLLVLTRSLCPACFGCYQVDWREIRAFLRRRYAAFLALDLSETDWDLIDHVRPRLMEKEGAPGIVRALGQEYHFLLNEILARHLLDGSPPGPERLS